MMGLWAWYSPWIVSLLPLTPLSWEEKSRPTKIKWRVKVIQLVGGAVLCLVTQSYLTLCDPMDCSLPGSSIHGISQARILEWVAISSSRGSSQKSNPGLPHCRWLLYHLSHQGGPVGGELSPLTRFFLLHSVPLKDRTGSRRHYNL